MLLAITCFIVDTEPDVHVRRTITKLRYRDVKQGLDCCKDGSIYTMYVKCQYAVMKV